MRPLALAMLPLLAAPGATSAAASADCSPPGEKIVAASDRVLVTRAREGRDHVFRSCVPATGRRAVVLRRDATEWHAPVVGPFAIAGRRLAFGAPVGHGGTGRGWVIVLAEAGMPRSTQLLPLPSQPREIVADASGRAAVRTRTTIELVAPDGSRQVDAAVAGTLSVLTVDAGVARWRHAGAERAAPLDLPAACPAHRDAYVDTQSAVAVAGMRPGRPGGPPGFAVLCRFAGGGWMDLGPGDALLAGELVGVRRGFGRRATVVVRRVADLRPVRPPVPVGDGTWALAADGTVAVAPLGGRRLRVHPPDGARRSIQTGGEWVGWLGIDEVADAISWIGDEGTATASLRGEPGPCGRPDEQVVTQGEDLLVVERTVPDRGDDDAVYIACRPSTGRRERIVYRGDSWDSGTDAGPFAIAGSQVAWVTHVSVRGNASTDVIVLDFDRSKQQTLASLSPPTVESIAVSPSGRVAVFPSPSLLVADDDGVRRIDAAVPGGITDLAFAGDELSWRHAGRERRIVAPLPATCDPPDDVSVRVQGTSAATGARLVPGPRGRDRDVPVVCAFAGGGWVDLPGGGSAELAGSYVATAAGTDDRARVVVRDLATLTPVGAPVAAGRSWALMSDGTVVVAKEDGYALHRLDGEVTVWQADDPAYGFLVDEVARAIAWHPYNGTPGSTPIP